MISLWRERAKALLTRFGGARVQTLRGSSARVHASRRWFLFDQNQTSICGLSPEGPSQRLSLCCPASLETIRGVSGAYAPSPSRQLARPGRLRAEKPLLYFRRRATRRCDFSFYRQKIFFTAIDRNQVRYQLPRHGQRRAVCVALLFFSVIDQRQVRVVSQRHLRRFDQQLEVNFQWCFSCAPDCYRYRATNSGFLPIAKGFQELFVCARNCAILLE